MAILDSQRCGDLNSVSSIEAKKNCDRLGIDSHTGGGVRGAFRSPYAVGGHILMPQVVLTFGYVECDGISIT